MYSSMTGCVLQAVWLQQVQLCSLTSDSVRCVWVCVCVSTTLPQPETETRLFCLKTAQISQSESPASHLQAIWRLTVARRLFSLNIFSLPSTLRWLLPCILGLLYLYESSVISGCCRLLTANPMFSVPDMSLIIGKTHGRVMRRNYTLGRRASSITCNCDWWVSSCCTYPTLLNIIDIEDCSDPSLELLCKLKRKSHRAAAIPCCLAPGSCVATETSSHR